MQDKYHTRKTKSRTNITKDNSKNVSGPDKNKRLSDFISVSKRMVIVAVTEASLEANYQLYINFILFIPTVLRQTDWFRLI